MSAPAVTAPAPVARPARTPVADTKLVAGRILKGYLREPTLIIFLVIQPIMFVLLFVYVFGGAIELALPQGINYVDFLMGGILVQTVVFGTAGTTVGITYDLSKGITDRFRSLPMWHGAVLAGRAVIDLLQALFTVALMVGVGFLLGFRIHQGLASFLGAVGLMMLVGFAFSWIALWVGLLAKTPEAAQSGGLIWMFPLTFLSSAFVPVESMPGWLQPLARNNPINAIINAVRGLTLGVPEGGQPVESAVVQSLVWCAVITVVFMPLAVRTFRRSGL